MNDLPYQVSPTLLLALPGLRLYALCAVLLVVKMFAMGFYTALVRSRLKVATNAEPPQVARILKAHRNDLESIPSFLFLALVAVLLGAPAVPLKIVLVVYTAARVAYSIAYLRSMQPWRTIFFGLGTLSMFTTAVLVLIRVFGGA